jgi:hypothetical protein
MTAQHSPLVGVLEEKASFYCCFLRSGKWLYLFTSESGGITLIGAVPRHIPQLVHGMQ